MEIPDPPKSPPEIPNECSMVFRGCDNPTDTQTVLIYQDGNETELGRECCVQGGLSLRLPPAPNCKINNKKLVGWRIPSGRRHDGQIAAPNFIRVSDGAIYCSPANLNTGGGAAELRKGARSKNSPYVITAVWEQ